MLGITSRVIHVDLANTRMTVAKDWMTWDIFRKKEKKTHPSSLY
jgi:hypothetical protein